MRTLRRYWPWWVAIAWMLGYETFAIVAGRPTLSQLYWRAQDSWSPLPFVVIAVVVVLLAHFVWKKWQHL